jgi:PGF-pre-PGF domain-containing protein
MGTKEKFYSLFMASVILKLFVLFLLTMLAAPAAAENFTNSTGNFTEPATGDITKSTTEDFTKSTDGNLTVHFIDVGQGDSILLEYVNYVKSEGIKSLDYVVATHPHEDHIGGMDVILNDFPIGKFIDSGYTHTTQTYEDMLNMILSKNIPFTTVKRGDKINFASGIVVQVLNPGSSYFTDDLNQNSVVLKVTDRKVSFLFMGDAGVEAENAIIKDGYNVNSDILKVGHHGSSTSSGSTFISAVSPKVSVIEVGAGNEYGHPYAGTLDTLQKASTVYRTDLDGTVTVTTDGSTYTVSTENTQVTSPTVPTETEDTGSSNSGSSGSHSSGGSHHSSGGSGGGAGGSPEPQKNVEVKDTTKVFISGDKPVYFNFTNDVTVVDYISFTSEKTVGKTTAIVENLKDKSSLVSELPDGIAYKSFNVWVGNAGYGDSSSILDAAISFKVDKSWIQENNIDPSSILLYKYDGKKKEWEKLSVNLENEDNEFLYFTANVPGYSSFVITGEKGKQSTLESEPVATVKSGNVKDSASTIAAKATEGNEKSPGFELVFGLVSLLCIFLKSRGR